MSKKELEIIEENGVVIYDESDDYDPGEDEKADYQCGEFHLMANEEIFTDEYMRGYAERMDAKIRRECHVQQMISACVIISVILYISLITFICFKGIF